MIKKLILLVALLPLIATAETTNEGYYACKTEGQLSELFQYLASKDTNGFQHLVTAQKCTLIPPGLRISVIDRGFTKSKIRIYVGENSLVLWAPSEIIKR